MKRTALLLALMSALTASAQMWKGLATSDPVIDTTDVKALKVELDNLSFFRDNEYTSNRTNGYSLPGLWLQPKLIYVAHKMVRLELGLHALIFNGANKYPCYAYHDIATWKGSQYQSGAHLLPWFRAQFEFNNVDIILGDIYGGENHGLIEPLFNTETNLSQDPEMGLQILWRRPHLRADIWLNWQSYIFKESTHQEAFTVGSTWRVLLNNEEKRTHWYLPVQLMIQHRGGEQDVESLNLGVQTICNLSAGVGVRHRFYRPCLTHIAGEVNAIGAYQQAGKLWPFKTGFALHAAGEVMLWDSWRLRLGHVAAPKHFISLYGNPLFNTVSKLDNELTYKGAQTTYLRTDYGRTVAKHYTFGGELEIFKSWLGKSADTKRSEFNFAFGVYIRVNPSFLIKRFK